MKNIQASILLLFLTVGPVWYGWVIHDDLSHPELWDRDGLHDPRVYMPLFPAVTILSLALVWWASKTETELAWRARFFDRFLEFVRWKERQGNLQDAIRAVELFKELKQWEADRGKSKQGKVSEFLSDERRSQ